MVRVTPSPTFISAFSALPTSPPALFADIFTSVKVLHLSMLSVAPALIFPTNAPAFDLPETSSELLDKLTARLVFSSIVPQARPALSPPDTSTWTPLLRVISRSTVAPFFILPITDVKDL